MPRNNLTDSNLPTSSWWGEGSSSMNRRFCVRSSLVVAAMPFPLSASKEHIALRSGVSYWRYRDRVVLSENVMMVTDLYIR